MSRLVLCLSALLGFVSSTPGQARSDALPPGAIARLGQVRYRNVGRVFSVAFSPDGKTLVAGAWDGSIRLWDLATRQELRQYTGHTGWVRSVAFSPDGKTLASGGKDKIIRLWETATGREIHQLKGHESWIQCLAFSPDGRTLASRGTGQDLRLWDVATGKEARRIAVQPFGDPSFAFSPKENLLAYHDDRRSITLLDILTGKEVRRITRARSGFGQLAFSPDGTILAGVYSKHVQAHTIYLWETATGKELRSFPKLAGNDWTVLFSPHGWSIASAGGDHEIRVWEVSTRQERCRFRSPDKNPTALAYAPDGRTLAQGSDDATVLLWDVTGLQENGRLRATELSSKELRALWAELANADAAAAHRALWMLTAGSRQSLSFLQEQLRPIAPVDASRVSRLVTDLNSDRFETRREANEQLEKLGALAGPALREVLHQKPPAETRRRIERLLVKWAVEKEYPSPEGLRQLRAVEVLEHMDSPAAQRLLEQLAQGAPGAELTEQAKASLERLSKRLAPRP
jgi:WD40 repeat protein